MKTVKNRWSLEVSVISSLTIAIIIGGIVFVGFISRSINESLPIQIILVLIPLISYIWAPKSISASRGKLTCQLGVKSFEIDSREIVSIEAVDRSFIRTSMRLFGSGGLFGFYGTFRNLKLGKYYMYITERNNLMMVTTVDKKYIFNCDNIEEFKVALKR